MKSSDENLEQRGFLKEGLEIEYKNLCTADKIELLKSKVPKDRTLAARLLKEEIATENVIEHLINALIIETKLYPKIEISNTLIYYGKPSVKPLINILGEVGNNQHTTVPEKEFKKDNYPLPRDIASRILAHIGEPALTDIMNSIEQFDVEQLSEAIDAAGFICFYNYRYGVYELLKNCYQRKFDCELIIWKIIRAFSGIPESEGFLESEKENLQSERLKKEIERSISLIKKRKQQWNLK